MRKRVLAGILSLAMMVSLAGCGGTESKEASSTDAAAEKSYTIGISQFAEHGSLDNCREGFLEGLKEAGIEEGKNLTVEVKNADADMGTASQIAQNFVSDEEVDLICAIATPSAQSAYSAAEETKIPVVYTAVTNPIAAELATDDKKPVGNVTGTSDVLPVEAQLKLIRKILPDAKKIGILYSTGEANSVSTLEDYKRLAPEYGFEIVDKGISKKAEVPAAADVILNEVDCISNMTDNNVVNNLDTLLAKATDAGIPVFGSEIEQVVNGCAAAMGLDYIELGRQTGKMAAAVLNGEDAASMPVQVISSGSLYVNSEVMSQFGLTIPDAYADAYTEVNE